MKNSKNRVLVVTEHGAASIPVEELEKTENAEGQEQLSDEVWSQLKSGLMSRIWG